jgi:hypothetical protein
LLAPRAVDSTHRSRCALQILVFLVIIGARSNSSVSGAEAVFTVIFFSIKDALLLTMFKHYTRPLQFYRDLVSSNNMLSMLVVLCHFYWPVVRFIHENYFSGQAVTETIVVMYSIFVLIVPPPDAIIIKGSQHESRSTIYTIAC